MENALDQEILVNAVSSLKEGLIKYKNVVDLRGNEIDQYKFAIMHFAHFIELALKYYISTLHPLLIYKNPSDVRIANQNKWSEVKTISLDESIQILKNNGHYLSHEFDIDLKFIKKIRNQIIHSKFSFIANEVDEKLGRVVKLFKNLNNNIFDIELESLLDEEEIEIFEKLSTSYLAKLRQAKLTVQASYRSAYRGRLDPKEADGVNWNCFICPECEEETLIPNFNSKTGYRCTFCQNEESVEIEVGCPACGDHPSLSFNDDGAEQFYCSYHTKLFYGED